MSLALMYGRLTAASKLNFLQRLCKSRGKYFWIKKKMITAAGTSPGADGICNDVKLARQRLLFPGQTHLFSYTVLSVASCDEACREICKFPLAVPESWKMIHLTRLWMAAQRAPIWAASSAGSQRFRHFTEWRMNFFYSSSVATLAEFVAWNLFDSKFSFNPRVAVEQRPVPEGSNAKSKAVGAVTFPQENVNLICIDVARSGMLRTVHRSIGALWGCAWPPEESFFIIQPLVAVELCKWLTYAHLHTDTHTHRCVKVIPCWNDEGFVWSEMSESRLANCLFAHMHTLWHTHRINTHTRPAYTLTHWRPLGWRADHDMLAQLSNWNCAGRWRTRSRSRRIRARVCALAAILDLEPRT